MVVSHESPKSREGYVTLVRTSALARRPGVVLLDEDLSALNALTGSTPASHNLVALLEREGYLQRVRRGAYALGDPAGGIRAGLLDLIAALTPKPYLVTAGRALQFHGLSDQHFRRVHVLVPKQLRTWSWRGDVVRYSRTDRSLRGDSTRTRKTKAFVAMPSRAIADCLAHPGWGVTLPQVVEALDIMLAREPGFADRLAGEAVAYDSHAVARRLGFLVAHLAGDEAARPFLALRGNSKAATPLRAGANGVGPVDHRWNVRENVGVARLLQHRRVM